MQIETKLDGTLAKFTVTTDAEGQNIGVAVVKVVMCKQDALFIDFPLADLNRFKSITPDFKFKKHVVEILGKSFSVLPSIPKITANDETSVIVDFVLPLMVTKIKPGFYDSMCHAVGTSIEVEFAVEQLEIPGSADDVVEQFKAVSKKRDEKWGEG